MALSLCLSYRLRCAGVVCVAAAMLAAGVPVTAKSNPPAAYAAEKRPLQNRDIYLPSVMQWERAAGAEKSHLNIAVFYPWGEFVGGQIAVVRLPNGQMAAQPEEEFSLRRGSWTRKGKDVQVESKWVRVELAEKKKRGKTVKETWFTDPKNDKELSRYIMIGGAEYTQAQALTNPEVLESMFNRPLEDPKKDKKKKK